MTYLEVVLHKVGIIQSGMGPSRPRGVSSRDSSVKTGRGLTLLGGARRTGPQCRHRRGRRDRHISAAILPLRPSAHKIRTPLCNTGPWLFCLLVWPFATALWHMPWRYSFRIEILIFIPILILIPIPILILILVLVLIPTLIPPC